MAGAGPGLVPPSWQYRCHTARRMLSIRRPSSAPPAARDDEPPSRRRNSRIFNDLTVSVRDGRETPHFRCREGTMHAMPPRRGKRGVRGAASFMRARSKTATVFRDLFDREARGPSSTTGRRNSIHPLRRPTHSPPLCAPLPDGACGHRSMPVGGVARCSSRGPGAPTAS